jgi:phosphatidylglycerol:prolipoprotein diacylglycerol transferase
VHPRLFQLGNVSIPTAGAFTALALVVALITARAIARRLALDPERVWDLGIAGVLSALIGPRLVLIATHWSDFRAHPLWMLGLVSVRSPVAVAIGTILAIGAMLAFAYFSGLPLKRTADGLAPAFALGYTIYWIGAFIAGTRFGTPTDVSWAVTYSSRLASIWNHTPLGTPLHPVQLYEAAIEFCLFALTITLLLLPAKRRLRDGEIMGAWLFLHGTSSFFLNFIRGDLAVTGVLLSQIAATAMVIAGGTLWLL